MICTKMNALVILKGAFATDLPAFDRHVTALAHLSQMIVIRFLQRMKATQLLGAGRQ